MTTTQHWSAVMAGQSLTKERQMAELRTYFNKRQNNDVLFDNGADPETHKPRPPIIASFRRHMFKTDDAKLQSLLEAHQDHGKRFWRVDEANKPVVSDGPKYNHGVTTTAADPKPTSDPKPTATSGKG